jgi:hypothetical protein
MDADPVAVPDTTHIAFDHPATAPPRRGLRGLAARLDPAIALLLALPLLLLLLYPEWVVNRWNNCDPWIYTGYFLDYPRHVRISDQGYFGTRLSVILPGYLVYRVFRPVTANYVLHLLLYEVSVLSLFATLKRAAGRRAALMAAVLMGCHAFFLWEIGWDYVDSFGIAYYLLATWALAGAARERWKTGLVAAGACAAALVYCNLSYVVFLPMLAGQYLFTASDRRWRSLGSAALLAGCGAAGLTVLLGVIHASLGGRFWFYWPSIEWAFYAMQRPNPYKSTTYEWVAQATWLVLPGVVGVGGVGYLLRSGRRDGTDRRPAIFFQLNLLATYLLLVFLHLRGKPVLQYWYECSLLVPVAFLAAGPQLRGLVEHWRPRPFAAVCGLAVLLALAPYTLPLAGRLAGDGWLPASGPAVGVLHPGGAEGLHGPGMMLLPALTGLAGFLLLRLNRHGVLTAALVFALVSFSNFTIARVGFFEPLIRKMAPNTKGTNPDVFRAVVRSIQAVQANDPAGKLYFSFERDEPHFAVFHDVALAALWLGNLEPDKFPFTRTGSCLQHVRPAPHDKLVILSSDPAAVHQTHMALRQAGLDGRLLTWQAVRLPTVKYFMSFVEILAPQSGGAP